MAHSPNPARYDLFVCHAGEDYARCVAPLRAKLEAKGISYWVSEAEIGLGDSIIDRVNEGLRNSRYLLALLSRKSIAKGWPMAELNAVLQQQLDTRSKRVLPVIIDDPRDVLAQLPILNSYSYSSWSEGLDVIVARVEQAIV
jgi:RNA-directed DNA polymerase